MATPKIKIYRLFPGYSSLNDNDIQESVNDQLLPVMLKNIMPNNAYELVGVSYKEKQALIPITVLKKTDLVFTVNNSSSPTIMYMRYISSGDNKSLHIAMKQKNRRPIFKYPYTNTDTTNTDTTIVDRQVEYNFFETKQQAIQFYQKDKTKNSSVYFDLNKQRWVFLLSDDFIKVINPLGEIRIEYEDEYAIASVHDVTNIYLFNITENKTNITGSITTVTIANGQSISQFTLNAFLTNPNNMYQEQQIMQGEKKVKNKIIHTDMFVNSQSMVNYLNPQIYFDVFYTDYTVATSDVILGKVECPICEGDKTIVCNTCLGSGECIEAKCKYCQCSNCDGIGNVVCEKCGGNKVIVVNGVTTPCTTCEGVGSIQCEICEGNGYTGTQDCICENGKVTCQVCAGNKIVEGVNCENCAGEGLVGCSLCGGEGKISCSRCNGEGVVYKNRKQKIVFNQKNGNFTINKMFKLATFKTKVLNIFAETKDDFDYLFTQQSFNNKKLDELIKKGRSINLKYYLIDKIQPVLSNQKLFASLQQDLYSGNSKSKKPNTLYLQYNLLGTMKDYIVNKITSQQYEISFSNKPLCRGIIDVKTQTVQESIKYRGVYLKESDYNNQYYNSKGLDFPQHNYLLDVDKGIFKIETLDYELPCSFCNSTGEIEQIVDCEQCVGQQCTKCNGTGKINVKTECLSCGGIGNVKPQYCFCSYYHRSQYSKTFVSDYQTWVSEHLRNNPDIFYGKYDYQGDNYLDANDNPITVGAIPKYMQSGYSILYRNGAVNFASTMQDFNYTDSTGQAGSIVDGVYKGGVARANFAYYKGLQNVIQQKLDYEKDYAGGGYKYRALKDCQYPDSIGRRWVKRDNTAQFIGVSFTTQKNENGKIKTYNLPDLQTKQLENLGRYSFERGKEITTNTNQIHFNYNILSNSFDYPHVFKISNVQRGQKYVSGLTDAETLKNTKYSTNSLNDFSVDGLKSKFSFDSTLFMKNTIDFTTLQNEVISSINTQYNQFDGTYLPILNVNLNINSDIFKRKLIEISEDVSGYNINYIKIAKNNVFDISNVKLVKIHRNEDNKIVVDGSQDISDVKGDFVLTESELGNYTGEFYITYTVNVVLRRSNIVYSEQQELSDFTIDSNGRLILPQNYKCAMFNTQQFIFYVNNLYQSVYFKLKVLDFNHNSESYNSTIVYTIKKYQE